MDRHADRYRERRLALDAALRARARLPGDPPAPAGRCPVLVYLDGLPRWAASHPLPERRPQRARTFDGRTL